MYPDDRILVAVVTNQHDWDLVHYEDWPHPYDGPGNNTNIYYPMALPGFSWPYADNAVGFDTFEVTRYSCDRYTLNVDSTDTSIYVSVITADPSYLEVFLVDPESYKTT